MGLQAVLSSQKRSPSSGWPSAPRPALPPPTCRESALLAFHYSHVKGASRRNGDEGGLKGEIKTHTHTPDQANLIIGPVCLEFVAKGGPVGRAVPLSSLGITPQVLIVKYVHLACLGKQPWPAVNKRPPLAVIYWCTQGDPRAPLNSDHVYPKGRSTVVHESDSQRNHARPASLPSCPAQFSRT